VIIKDSDEGDRMYLALAFDERPPFAHLRRGITFPPRTREITMILGRHRLNGKPWGPWVEATGGGHYEIEA
jgi:hypothetical protein